MHGIELLGQPDHIFSGNLPYHLARIAIDNANHDPAGMAVHDKRELIVLAEESGGIDCFNGLDQCALVGARGR